MRLTQPGAAVRAAVVGRADGARSGSGRGQHVAGELVAQFPATMGSKTDPLPLGKWTIKGISYNPDWQYNPAILKRADKSDPKMRIPPGPNNPVGVAWIDLSKPHYGIHGTPEPSRVGKSQSHGCIRLTNWDAKAMSEAVATGITALLQE